MKYRNVSVSVWSDRRFLSLSRDAKNLWLFFLTGPSTCSIPGVIVGGEASLAEQAGFTVEEYRTHYQEILDRGLKVRSEGRLTYLLNAFKHQRVAGPKAIVGMAKLWDDIPECELKSLIWQDLKIACKSWRVLFEKSFPMGHAMGYAQTSMEGYLEPHGKGYGMGYGIPLDTGNRNRNRNRTDGSASREPHAPARSQDPAPDPLLPDPIATPEPEAFKPDLRLVPLDPPDPASEPTIADDAIGERGPGHREIDRRRSALLRDLGHAHVIAYAEAKQAIGSTVHGPHVTDRFEELRVLLDDLITVGLDDDVIRERVTHVLVVGKAEAIAKRTMKYFGPGIWKPSRFQTALTHEVADVDGTRDREVAITHGGPQRRSAFDIAAEVFANMPETITYE